MAGSPQFLFSGLTVGAVYALVALGFTLIYNASGVVNFAQGEFVMLGSGMVTVFTAAASMPLPVAARQSRSAPPSWSGSFSTGSRSSPRGVLAVAIIITIGASILLRGIAQIVFDKQFHKLPPFTGDTPVNVFGAAVQPQSFWVMGGAAFVVLTLYLFLEKTVLGKAVLATAANRLAARLVGINTSTIMALAFGGSAAIGAITGILITPITTTTTMSARFWRSRASRPRCCWAEWAIRSEPSRATSPRPFGSVRFRVHQLDLQRTPSRSLVILVVSFAAPNGLFGHRMVERV